MPELLKYVQSEIDSSFSDWYDECNSFLTEFLSSLFDGLVAPFSFFRGGLDV